MSQPVHRVVAALLLATVSACQASPGTSPAGQMAFDRPPHRRDPASVPRLGAFVDLATARARATQPQAPDPAVRGRVVAAVGPEVRPLEGAIVSTSDGRAGITNASGEFAIAGAWPADGAFVAAHDAFVASGVGGLAEGEAPTFHLTSRATVAEGPGAFAEAPFVVRGRVTGPNGAPAGGVLVVLSDARGAFSAPAVSDAAGAVDMTVYAPGRLVEDGTVLAAGAGLVGIVEDVGVTADASSDIAITLSAADRRIEIALEASAMGGAPEVALDLVGPAGATLGLPAESDGTYRVAPLPGTRIAFRADVRDAIRGTESSVYRPEVALAETGLTRIAESLLAPPGAELDPVIVLNEALRWREVPGALGYSMTLAGQGTQGFLWEGFTEAPAFALSFQGDVGPGAYTMTLTAWDAPGIGTRSVASLGDARALRLPGHEASARRSSRSLQVTI